MDNIYNMNPGWLIYGTHKFIIFVFLVIFASRPNLRPLLIAVFIPIVFLHVLGYPCPLTRIERYYHGQNVTIIDSYIKMIGLEINHENRHMVQGYFSSLVLLAMILTVWVYPSK